MLCRYHPFPLITAEGFQFYSYESEDKRRLLITGSVNHNGVYKGGRFIITNEPNHKLIYAGVKLANYSFAVRYYSQNNIFFREDELHPMDTYPYWKYTYSIVGIYESIGQINYEHKDKLPKILLLKARLTKLLL